MHMAACYLVKQIQWQINCLTFSFEWMPRVRKKSLLWAGGRSGNLLSQHLEKALHMPLCFPRSFHKCLVPLFSEKKDNKATYCFLNALLTLRKNKQLLKIRCIRNGNLFSQVYTGISLWRSWIIFNYTYAGVSFVLHLCKEILVERSCTPLSTEHCGFLPCFSLFILDDSLSFLQASIRNHCKNPWSCYYFSCFLMFNFHWMLLFSFSIAYIPV